MRRRGMVPTIDVGLVAQLRLGTVEVVPAIRAFQGSGVELTDGHMLRPDAVIAATGSATTQPNSSAPARLLTPPAERPHREPANFRPAHRRT